MIATNIDGSSSGSNQLLDLLSVIANTDNYTAKLKELQTSIDENQKILNLVGPATEILHVREELATTKAQAENEVAAMVKEASDTLRDAKSKATASTIAAKEKAASIVADAEEIKAKALALQAAADAANSAANSAKTAADARAKDFEAQTANLAKAIAEAKVAKQKAEDMQANIIAKHRAFIESF